MPQNPRKQLGGPKVEEGFPLWRNQTASRRNRMLEFRAGKMFVRENMVHPDTRKGLVYIYQDEEGVMHFCWMDRSLKTVEDDLVTMPADCTFKRVERCTTGRVYLLKMKSNGRVLFYWMQEPSAANDAHICNRVNSLLNFPPPRMLFPEQIFTNEFQFLLNQLNSEHLHDLLNGNDIVIIDSRNPPGEERNPTGQQQPLPAPPPPDPFVNLGEVINEESVKIISKNQTQMKKLEDKLPPVDGDKGKNLEDTVRGVPFKHAIEDFSLSLKQGSLGPTLRELNVNESAVAAAGKGDVDSFIRALQGGASSANQAMSGSPPGPGSSGSNGRQSKDLSRTRKEGEKGRKENTKQEETKTSNKQGMGEKKRTNDTSPGGVIQVHMGQQTEPVRITSFVQSTGPEMKIARKVIQTKVVSFDGELSHEKGQNTDPVVMEEYSSSVGYNWNIEQQTSGSSNGTVLTDQPRTNGVHTNLSEVGKRGKAANVVDDDMIELDDGTFQTKLARKKNVERDEGIVLMNNERTTSRKRHITEMSEHDLQPLKLMKFETSEAGLKDAITKVEGEQQTEPVRIKSAQQSLTEHKITTKRASARGQRNDGSQERSQNTDPVLIEEKQKKQAKPKDPKPSGQE